MRAETYSGEQAKLKNEVGGKVDKDQRTANNGAEQNEGGTLV